MKSENTGEGFGQPIPEQDVQAIRRQVDLVRAVMADGRWRCLDEITALIGGISEAGTSARLRQIRREGQRVDRRRLQGRRVYEYRVVTEEGDGARHGARVVLAHTEER